VRATTYCEGGLEPADRCSGARIASQPASDAGPGAARAHIPRSLPGTQRRAHKIDGYDLVTIEVVGRLTIAHSDGTLVYLGMCRPPDPQVLCVTYELDGRKVGDEVVLTGSYIPRGPNHIQLDPCLHHEPD
jgi:hypothetical protein